MIERRQGNDPDRIGEFRVIGRLGAGGFGTVYVAVQRERLDDLVAVKVMQSRLAREQDFRTRFGKEILAIKSVRSGYVPKLRSHGVDGETLWLATELVRGPSLAQVVRRSRRPLPEQTVWRLGLGLAAALRDIHGAKCLHRDLKPGNVLLAPDGPWIIDFGLAHLTEADHQTASGLPLCSPDYAPPEQRESLWNAVEYADVFTLGGTLVFASTGHAPYGGGRNQETSPPNLAGLPRSLYDVVAQCLCQDEQARPDVATIISHFENLTGVTADRDGLAFESVLTDGIVDVINAWRYELHEVVRLASIESAAGGARAGYARAALPPDPVTHHTAALTDARALTNLFDRDRDRGWITAAAPAPGPVRARPAEGRGVKLEWTAQLRDWVRAPVAVTRDMAVAATLGGAIFSFAHNRRVLGRANLGVPVRSAVLPPGATTTGWAYAGGADGVVYGIDLASGHHWPLLYAAGAIEGPPVAMGDRIYALSSDGYLREIDAYASGNPARVCYLGGPALGTLTARDGIIVAASAEGWVYAIDEAGQYGRALADRGPGSRRPGRRWGMALHRRDRRTAAVGAYRKRRAGGAGYRRSHTCRSGPWPWPTVCGRLRWQGPRV